MGLDGSKPGSGEITVDIPNAEMPDPRPGKIFTEEELAKEVEDVIASLKEKGWTR